MDNDHVDFIIFYCQEADYNNFIAEFVVAKSLFSQDKAPRTVRFELSSRSDRSTKKYVSGDTRISIWNYRSLVLRGSYGPRAVKKIMNFKNKDRALRLGYNFFLICWCTCSAYSIIKRAITMAIVWALTWNPFSEDFSNIRLWVQVLNSKVYV